MIDHDDNNDDNNNTDNNINCIITTITKHVVWGDLPGDEGQPGQLRGYNIDFNVT